MATGPFNTTVGAVLNPTVISAAIEVEAATAQVFRPLVATVDFMGPGSVLDIPRIVPMAAPSSYTEGDARVFSYETPTKGTYTPGEIDQAMSFTDKQIRRGILAHLPVYQAELGKSAGRKIDSDLAGLAASFTGGTITDGAAATYAKLVEAIGKVRQQANDNQNVIFVVEHTVHWAQLLAEANIAEASITGTPTGAARSGRIDLVGGGAVFFSNAIGTTSSPVKNRNMAFTPRTMVLVLKQDITGEAWRSEDNKAFRIAVSADYATGVYMSGEGVEHQVG